MSPSGLLRFTDVTTDTPVAGPVTLDTSTAVASLQPQVPTSTGANTLPVWTTLADVNGDGKLDLITSLYETDSVSVQLGNGDGTFQAATNILIATGFGPAEVHAVSLGNGTVDLIVGSFNLNEIVVLLGNGNGTFGAPAFYTVGSATNTPTSLTTGDFNDDGKLDVAVANTGDNTISILLGDGTGGLTVQRPAINVGRDPEAIRAGDFNGDGYSDLAVANYSDGTVTTLLNDKDGTFNHHHETCRQRRGFRPAGVGHQRQREQPAAGGRKLQGQHRKRDAKQWKRFIRSTNHHSRRQGTGRREFCRFQWRRDSRSGRVQLHR
jgi:FG-GAP-like repeat